MLVSGQDDDSGSTMEISVNDASPSKSENVNSEEQEPGSEPPKKKKKKRKSWRHHYISDHKFCTVTMYNCTGRSCI